MPEWLGIVLWIVAGSATVLGVFAMVGSSRFIVMSTYNKDFWAFAGRRLSWRV